MKKKNYRTLEELQNDLYQWLSEYNIERTHQGKICNGKTPLPTINDGLKVTMEKVVGL